MKFFAVFCLIALAAFANAQQQTENEVKFVIDPFTAQSDTIVILIPSGGIVENLVDSNFATSGSIMGGERDLQLTVSGGSGNLVLTTGVSGGVYTSATPNEARGNSLLQLDGSDGTMTINTSGLFSHPNNNFMSEGAFAFRILIESDLPGSVIFRVFSGGAANRFCSTVVSTPGDDTLNEYILPYSSFTGDCNFADVGALEILVAMDDNIDVLMSDWSTYGPVVTCVCFCPEFTCLLTRDYDGSFSYYLTSQFNQIVNPTTDFSTIPTTGGPSFSNPTTDLSTVFSTVFSTDLFSSLSTFFSSFNFTTFTNGVSSFTSLFSNSSSSSSSSGSSSSSSDASVLSASIVLIDRKSVV